MFELFKSQYPTMKVSYEAYRLRVKVKNISFASLGHEECERCEEFKLHDHTKDDLQENCEKCCSWKKHIDHAKDSRELYQTHAKTKFEDGTVCFSVDLQKVIMLPRVDTFKTVLFIKRLTTYNESFVPVGIMSKQKPFAVLWNEAISGRDKEDIVSCFYAFFLKHRDAPKIILWLDNCSSQNKNWCLLSFFVRIINSSEILASEILINFFEPGHTFMSADSFHHQVELSLKRKGKVYDFNDFVEAVQKAQKSRTEVKIMSHHDFYQWKDLKSEAKMKQQKKRIYLSDIVQIKATRGSFFLHYKSSLNNEFEKLDFLYKKAMTKGGIFSQFVPLRRTAPRGFPKTKKDAIIKNLGNIMPENRKEFWINLPETDN
ncbi:uncharacterized protein LOC115891019 [Sitophilus oryzae]|nr:uncharacterized protein LOC115875115 [Sitophilus oryzae]XP_030767270.1 uncharacterized protein LOC115891019 [Sitophilus oryzae]